MNPRIASVQYQSPYKLILTFGNNEAKEFDLTPYLHYPVYQPLKDESFCSKAKACMGTVVWNDEIDSDPDILYLESKNLSVQQTL